MRIIHWRVYAGNLKSRFTFVLKKTISITSRLNSRDTNLNNVLKPSKHDKLRHAPLTRAPSTFIEFRNQKERVFARYG